MKAGALRDMSRDELLEKLKELREGLFNLKFQKVTGQLENTAQITKNRKDIARIMTILGETDRKNAAQG
ncbi:MAG: 50S ribosomal protein L29 [Deltaproteobacteria bacterium]|jgi:large subunit ribosomal protein L29|nr:50S ribosomal protein L29 [Deltaproteobacteria bacterium]